MDKLLLRDTGVLLGCFFFFREVSNIIMYIQFNIKALHGLKQTKNHGILESIIKNWLKVGLV